MTVSHTPASTEMPAAALHRPTKRRWPTRLALFAILLLGAYLRLLSLFTWDEPSFRLHPDERFFTDVASTLQVPSSFAEYLDSARNPLNPRNYTRSTWFVYGLLPQTLTQFTAVMLTPNTALSACVDRPDVPPPDLVIGQPCGDPTVDSYQNKLANNDLHVPKLLLLQKLFNPEGRDLTGFYEIFKVGRAWSALFDLCSVLLIFLIGRRLYGRRVGLLAALLLACAVLPIQLAHFFTVDAATGFFVLLAIYWGVRCAQGGGLLSFVALGLAIGGAMACRVTLATLGLIGVCAVLARLLAPHAAAPSHGGADDDAHVTPPHPVGLFALLALAGLLAVLTFRLLQPDAFIGSSFFDLRPEPRFVENIQRIGLYVSGEADAPPNQQWAGRVPYLFPLQNMVLWGLGLPLGLAALAGWAAAGWQLLRRRRLVHLIPWLWVTLYFAWQGGQFVTTMRYYASLYGLLCLLAAWALVAAWRRVAGRSPDARSPRWNAPGAEIMRLAAIGATVAVVLGTALWAYAFTRIYTVPHARITASRWIYAHVPAGATITSEAWDDGLPLNLDGRSSGEYTNLQMQPYAEDEPSKYVGTIDANGVAQLGLLDQLDQADYLIYSSNRVYDSTKRLPMKYPALTRYWHALFTGELGFTLIADIHSYPTLFGIEIPTPVLAEEAFSVYDHPRVLVFQKTPAYTRKNAEQLITSGIAWNEVYKLSSFVGGKVPTALRLTEAQWPGYLSGGASVMPSLFGSLAPWLVWLVVLELLGFAMFALLFTMLPRLPDRGFALAKTLGVLLVAWAAWLLASLGAGEGRPLLAFSPLSVWLCAALLIASGALVGWRLRMQLAAFWRARRAMLLTAEGLFLAAFFGFVIIRALNPDLWHPARGGEKPMDLAFLTATLRSAAFPPYDPWFAGGYINYYYFGFVFVGTLVHLSGVAPTVAYNLAVPTIFALTALGAFGIGFNLLAGRQRATDDRLRMTGAGRPTIPRGERRAIATGLVAALFMVLIGPLTQAIWFLPGTADQPDPGLPDACRAMTSYAAQQACRGRAEWAFWDATRLIGTTISQRTGGNDGTISEFPFFTFLFGDLHAHMIALPLALAALGLMLAMTRSEALHVPRAAARRSALMRSLFGMGSLALAIGALAATNTWDYPAYLGLSVLTLGFVAWRRWQAGGRLGRELLRWGAASVALAVLARLLFLPFHQSFATEYAGFTRWTGAGTGAAAFLKINGLWLALLLFGVLTMYRRMRGFSVASLTLVGTMATLLALAAALLDVPALAVLVPLLGAAIGVLLDLLLRGAERRGGPVSMALLLPALWACAAIGLTLLTEVIVAKGDIGRMNTVFKLGMQSWTLFALASAVAFTSLWHRSRVLTRRWSPVWLVRSAAVALVAAGMVYPLTATPAKIADRFDPTVAPTLDGAAYMHSPKARWSENGQDFSLAGDADALDWMRRTIGRNGAPIVLEAQTEGYRWGGRVAIYTGLPTLLGWPWHETQQRSVAQVQPVLESRRTLIQTLYTSSDTATTLAALRQYGVNYVYVGLLEQALYDQQGLAKFDRMVQAGQLEKVYDAAQTRIYHVRDGAPLPALLTTALPVVAPTLASQKAALLDRAVGALPAVPEYAWNRFAQSQPVAVALWLLALLALAALGLPLAALVFGRWHDGGMAFAPLIGLLLLGYAVWLPVSAGLWTYDRWGILLGALLIVLVDLLALLLRGRQDIAARQAQTAGSAMVLIGAGAQALVRQLRLRWRSGVLTGGLFLGAFAAMLLIRALNPDLWQPAWGGEKPFEFGFLNALVRSPVMPPYDPFYSGGTINYYYYGLYLVSLPVKVTGIAPAVAFNLIIPTLFAMTLIGAFAIVRQLTGRIGYGLIGAACVTIAGNLAAVFVTAGSWSKGLQPIATALGSGNLAQFGSRLDDWFIGPSRVIPYTINEFPFWSFLFADLHPHLIALPITLLAIALALAVVEARRTTDRGSRQPPDRGRSLAASALAALTLGALAVTNSWDFPTYTLLLAAALVGAVWLERRAVGGALLARRVAGALAQAALTAGAALLLYLPFFQNFKAMVGGIGMVHGGTMPESYAAIYGLFLLVLIPSLLVGVWRLGAVAARRAAHTALVPDRALGFAARATTPSRAAAMLPVGFGLLLIIVVAVQHQNPMILKLAQTGALLGFVALLLNRQRAPATWFALLLAALGFAVSIGIDTVYIRDHLAGDPNAPGDFYRMNTVFKFGMQIWTLFALAAAALLPLLLRGLRRWSAALEIIAAGALAALAALALVYPLAGTPSRVAYRFPTPPGPTLNGLAFMDTGSYDWNGNAIALHDDGAAIRWLNANISGTPVVLQSSMEFYRAYGVRVAANTGLPTVVSPLHESEQRDPGLVAERDADVNTFYRTTDTNEALRLLSKYRVGYVYVGPIERAGYGEDGMAKFAQLTHGALTPVFENATVTIYKVNDSVYSLPISLGSASAVVVLPHPAPPAPAAKPSQNASGQPTLADLENQNSADPQAAGPAFGLGQRYHDMGRLADALTVLARAAAAHPNDVALHHLWGDTLRDAKRYDEAVQAYTQAAQAQPTAGNYNKLGTELAHMARFDQAESALNQAIQLDPQVADPYFQLGLLYERQAKRDQARDAYARFLRLAPADSADRAAAELALKRLK